MKDQKDYENVGRTKGACERGRKSDERFSWGSGEYNNNQMPAFSWEISEFDRTGCIAENGSDGGSSKMLDASIVFASSSGY